MKTFYSNYTEAPTLYNAYVKKHPDIKPIFMSTTSVESNTRMKLSVTVIFEGNDPSDTEEVNNESSKLV